MLTAFRAPLAAAFLVFAAALPAIASPLILDRDTIVRKGPGEQYAHVWDWVAGTRIDITECKTSNWCYAFRLGKRGWINLDELGLDEDGGGTTADNGGAPGGNATGGKRSAPVQGGNNFVKADDQPASYPSSAQLLGGGTLGGGGGNSGGGGGGGRGGASAASEAAMATTNGCMLC